MGAAKINDANPYAWLKLTLERLAAAWPNRETPSTHAIFKLPNPNLNGRGYMLTFFRDARCFDGTATLSRIVSSAVIRRRY